MAREFTVKLEHNIGKACDHESTRYALGNVLIRRDRAIATNGRILAMVPCEAAYDDDKSTVIDRQVNGKALQSMKTGKDKTVRVNGRVEAKGKIFDNNEEGRFPTVEYVLKECPSNAFALPISVHQLKLLADSICADPEQIVTLLFEVASDTSTVESEVRVVVSGNEDYSESIGVIMPCGRTDHKNYADQDRAKSINKFNELRKKANPS